MNKAIPILITLFINTALGILSIYYLGDYGWTVFFLIPFLIGFMPPFLYGKREEMTKNQAYSLGFSALGLSVIELLVFAAEGFICIIMASPLLLLLTFIGVNAAYANYRGNYFKSPNHLLLLLSFVSIGFMSFDYLNDKPNLIAVKTQVQIDANIHTVWTNVVTFDKIDTPDDWIFKTGISYPTDATIKGEGVGAIRYCNFTTGSFVEPITTWDEPNLLQFDVKEQPIPMNEWNPFWDIHPPHLDGYFQSQKGQFQLRKIDKTTTLLEGTTWYKVDIQPEFYWKQWSDFIIHRIHQRVLNHIKIESEG